MYERLTEFKDIYEAYKCARRGKRKKNEVVKYETNLSAHIWNLQQRLENRCFHISGYHSFMVYDPKEREIQALSFADRVFQHLLCDKVLEPYLEPRLIYDNAACRKFKGTHFAMRRFKQHLVDHYKHHGAKGYILKFDIRKYFASIDHERLKEKLARFPDDEIKQLLYGIIDSYNIEESKGLPIGNQSSQWFALYYLDRLDRFIKEQLRIKYYVRYMDDGVIVHHDKAFLKEALRKMKELIAEDKLEFNDKTQILPLSQGADFLGFHYYVSDTGKIIMRLRSSNKRRFKRNLKRLKKLYNSRKVDAEHVVQSLNSYCGHLKHGHTWKLRKQVFGSALFTHASKAQYALEEEMLKSRDSSPLGPPGFGTYDMPRNNIKDKDKGKQIQMISESRQLK